MNYVLDPNDTWRTSAQDRHLHDDGVTTEVRDLVDKRNGHVYSDGAYRVRDERNRRTKVFKGETAWMNAARYASDWALANRRKEAGL